MSDEIKLYLEKPTLKIEESVYAKRQSLFNQRKRTVPGGGGIRLRKPGWKPCGAMNVFPMFLLCAAQMLSLAFPLYHKLGLQIILLVCRKKNIAFAKTIHRYGGIMERKFHR